MVYMIMVLEVYAKKSVYMEKQLQYMNQIKRNIYYSLLDVMNILMS